MEQSTQHTVIVQDSQQPKTDNSFRLRIGNTAFTVGLFFKKDGKTTLEERMKKLILDDVKNGNF